MAPVWRYRISVTKNERRVGSSKKLRIPCARLCKVMLLAAMLWGQSQIGECLAQEAQPLISPDNISGGGGFAMFSQFTNPALLGALYQMPNWPMTGYYPLYPGALLPIIPNDGIRLQEPLKLHPMMGVAQMWTDNVFRSNTNKKSDFFTTLAPGIQAQLPFAGRHAFLVDYRSNLQTYANTPSNDVQDQTASGRFNLDFPGGLKVDLAGEHKLGHDPRGTALDTRAFNINKWQANSLIGRAEYTGAQSSIRMDLRSTRMTYLAESGQQGPIQNRLINYAGLTFSRGVSPKTALLANVGVHQNIYDENKNLDNTIYQMSGGARWHVSELTSGEILIGVQQLQFTNAQVNQPPPVLSRFTRTEDSFTNFFVMGNVFWTPTSLSTINLQSYRTVRQTAVTTSLYFVATGANLGASHRLTDSTTLTLNVGIEHDDFTSASEDASLSSNRTDLLKNVSVGAQYQAVKWLGLGIQYIFEDRGSTQEAFQYQANTFMVSAQTLF